MILPASEKGLDQWRDVPYQRMSQEQKSLGGCFGCQHVKWGHRMTDQHQYSQKYSCFAGNC